MHLCFNSTWQFQCPRDNHRLILPITFEIVTDEYAEKKILPITFEIVTDECAENNSCRLLL